MRVPYEARRQLYAARLTGLAAEINSTVSLSAS